MSPEDAPVNSNINRDGTNGIFLRGSAERPVLLRATLS